MLYSPATVLQKGIQHDSVTDARAAEVARIPEAADRHTERPKPDLAVVNEGGPSRPGPSKRSGQGVAAAAGVLD